MEKNKKNYYKNNKKNYHKKNKQSNKEEKKVTYDSLMHAEITTPQKEEVDFDKLLVMKSIAISVVIFVIIVCSLILFSKM